MTPEQRWKLGSWVLLYVALPLMTYGLIILAAGAFGTSYGWREVLVDGDLLFFCVILLATTIDFSMTDLRLTTQAQSRREWANPLLALTLVIILVAVVFACAIQVIGRIDRLGGGRGPGNPEVIFWIGAVSVPGVILLCFGRYLYLLRRGNI